MGVVVDLQSEALSKNTDIMSLLRKAYLVSRKLKLTEFGEWVSRELNGYDVDEKVPKYRIYHGEVKAYNPYHGWIPVVFEAETDFSLHEAREPIANLVDVYNKSKEFVSVRFDDNINTFLSKYAPFQTKYQLQISTNLLFSTFESIRNAILEWSITLEESGIIGEGLQFTDSELKKASETPAIYQFTTNFYGDVNGTQVQQGTVDSAQMK